MKVLVVDDHKLIYDGLKAASFPDLAFRYTANAESARLALSEEPFSSCVLDLTLGEESGLVLLGEIAGRLPVFVLTMHRSFRALKTARELGARGYFLKDESMDVLFEALKDPSSPRFRHSPGIEALSAPRDPAPEDTFERLSLREKQIFVLLAEGSNYKEIAYRLGISPKTVNVHRQNIFRKMDLNSLVELVRLAYAMNLLQG